MEGICFTWPGRAFGDALMLAHLTKIVNDNGVSAVSTGRKAIRAIVDVPFYDLNKHSKYFSATPAALSVSLLDKTSGEAYILQLLNNISGIVGRRIEFEKSLHNYIPVVFYDIPETPSVDVVLCTLTGRWSPYRRWPYFKKLKKLFKKEGITYLDMHKEGVRGVELLNYVKRSGVYLGLETGTSHYVSRFANWKGLIIQSGYQLFSPWAYPYIYESVEYDVPCSPCFITRWDIRAGNGCQHKHECMFSITAEEVLRRIIDML